MKNWKTGPEYLNDKRRVKKVLLGVGIVALGTGLAWTHYRAMIFGGKCGVSHAVSELKKYELETGKDIVTGFLDWANK